MSVCVCQKVYVTCVCVSKGILHTCVCVSKGMCHVCVCPKVCVTCVCVCVSKGMRHVCVCVCVSKGMRHLCVCVQRYVSRVCVVRYHEPTLGGKSSDSRNKRESVTLNETSVETTTRDLLGRPLSKSATLTTGVTGVTQTDRLVHPGQGT